MNMPATPPATQLEMLRAALWYWNHGFCPVILHEVLEDGSCSCGDSGCKSFGKHPRLSNWPTAAAKATEADIRRLWGKHPNAQIGILCGDWSHVPGPKDHERKWIIALDVDAKAGGDGRTGIEVLSDWEDENGKLPATPSQKTRSGGYHYLFKHPGFEVITRSNILPKIDIRGDKNGQIVIAPSPGYSWDASPVESELADAPEALLQLLRTTLPTTPDRHKPSEGVPAVAGWPSLEVRAERARRYLQKVPGAVSGDGGHDRTWWAALNVVRGFALPLVEAYGVLTEYNQRCQPPWSEKELRHKIQSASEQARMPWGKLLEKQGEPKQTPEPTIPQNVNPETGEVEEWRAQLLRDVRGRVKSNLANAITILTNTFGWSDAVVHDDFASRLILQHPTPAHKGQPDEQYPRQWRDSDDILTAAWLQREWGFDMSPRSACDAVVGLAQKNRVHPVRRYLTDLRWDGVQRLPTWLSRYLGAEDSAYIRAVGTKWMISAVARIMRPGCQADAMLILEGAQGIRKSTCLETLASKPWFTDQLADLGAGREPSQDLAGKWIVEMAELDSLRRSDTSRAKAFLTRRTDHFRASYGRHSEDRPRQCVFCGSSNLDTYLTDETGNRRFWPVRVTTIDIAAIAADRDQLWAEAVSRFESNETWYLDDPALVRSAEAEQEARYQSDAWEATIATWLECEKARAILATQGWIETADLLGAALGLDKGKWGRSEQTRAGACMVRLGWFKRRFRRGSILVWGYVPNVPKSEEVTDVEF